MIMKKKPERFNDPDHCDVPDEDVEDDDVGGRLRDVGVSEPSHDEQPLLPSMK